MLLPLWDVLNLVKTKLKRNDEEKKEWKKERKKESEVAK